MRSLTLVVVAAALPWTALAFQADFNWTGTLTPGQTLEIKGVNGSIRAKLASGNIIEVSAHKNATYSDPSSVRIEVVPTGNGITICSVYAGGGTAANDCQDRKQDHSNTRDNDVMVDYTVKVPAGIAFHPGMVNGSITVTALRSDVRAASVNGNVKVSTTGLAHATTVNGSIDVSMGASEWNGTLDFTTVNGSIDLTLPSGTGADIRATTVSGELASDFPLTVHGRFGGRNMTGRIGAGGHDLKLTTVNGRISLHQGDGRAL